MGKRVSRELFLRKRRDSPYPTRRCIRAWTGPSGLCPRTPL